MYTVLGLMSAMGNVETGDQAVANPRYFCSYWRYHRSFIHTCPRPLARARLVLIQIYVYAQQYPIADPCPFPAGGSYDRYRLAIALSPWKGRRETYNEIGTQLESGFAEQRAVESPWKSARCRPQERTLSSLLR